MYSVSERNGVALWKRQHRLDGEVDGLCDLSIPASQETEVHEVSSKDYDENDINNYNLVILTVRNE